MSGMPEGDRTGGLARRKPRWIKKRVSMAPEARTVDMLLKETGLDTVCMSAACPNKDECWRDLHVTFMILGDRCTRNCGFCNIVPGEPCPPDAEEPGKIAGFVKKTGMRYVVITSVTRDDLADKGAGQFARTVEEIKKASPGTPVELLIPDMDADAVLLERVIRSGADVVGHNIELPERLYARIRPGADYEVSLNTLRILKDLSGGSVAVKSSMMVGLGEKESDITDTLYDLSKAGVDILYMGQYLSPSGEKALVRKYYTPEQFASLARKASDMGFKTVQSAPFARSSYRAYESYLRYTGSGKKENV